MSVSINYSMRGAIMALGLIGSSAHAAIVSGNYQGIIDEDSGLGLIGQTMQVDFSYEDTTAKNSGYFQDYLVSMAVSIGSNTWSWDSVNGSSYVFLDNDSVQVYSIGTEDRVTAGNDTFTGPDLVAGADGYNLDLYLSDNLPNGAPDGLTDDTVLPAVAPNPDLFNTPAPNANSMVFSFFTGDPEFGGVNYFITTSNVTNTAVVPLPPAAWLFGSALFGLGLIKRRPKS